MGKELVDFKVDSPFPEMMRFDVTQYDWYQDKLDGVLPSRYIYQRKQMDITELWVLLKKYKMTLIFDDGTEDVIVSKPGLVWDLASTPKILRGIVDNDAFVSFLAAFFHDKGFGKHLYSYEMCNSIFRKMIELTAEKYRDRYMAGKAVIAGNLKKDAANEYMEEKQDFIDSWVKSAYRLAGVYYFGVSTFIGEGIYSNNNPRNHWNYDFIEMN